MYLCYVNILKDVYILIYISAYFTLFISARKKNFIVETRRKWIDPAARARVRAPACAEPSSNDSSGPVYGSTKGSPWHFSHIYIYFFFLNIKVLIGHCRAFLSYTNIKKKI